MGNESASDQIETYSFSPPALRWRGFIYQLFIPAIFGGYMIWQSSLVVGIAMMSLSVVTGGVTVAFALSLARESELILDWSERTVRMKRLFTRRSFIVIRAEEIETVPMDDITSLTYTEAGGMRTIRLATNDGHAMLGETLQPFDALWASLERIYPIEKVPSHIERKPYVIIVVIMIVIVMGMVVWAVSP